MCGFKKQKKALTFYSQSLICHCNALVLLSFIILPYKTSALLAIFLGTLGIHNFYLGFTTKAIIQLVVSLLGAAAFGIGPVAIGIWALVEGIMILTGKINTDANGVALI